MASVPDLDVQLAREVGAGFGGRQRAWFGMIRAGAAITAEQQAHFDTSKTPQCLHCGVTDSKAHRLFDCTAYGQHDLIRIENECQGLQDLLLPAWHEELCAHLRALAQIECGGWAWCQSSCELLHVDLFTDGSCLYGNEDLLALGAWAVVCAQSQAVLASGQLPGLCQTIDRCELQAVVVALRWVVDMGAGATIWTDSQYVFDGLLQLLNGESVNAGAHPDLWHEVMELLEMAGDVFVQLVPSHVDPDECDDPVAAFATSWNRVADRQAVFMNVMRPVEFLQRHKQILDFRRRQRRRLFALANRYAQVAELTQHVRHNNHDPEEVLVSDLVPQSVAFFHDSFADLFPPDWHLAVPEGTGQENFDGREVVRRLISSDEDWSAKVSVTWVELVFVFLGWGCIRFDTARTLAYWVTCIRRLVRPLFIKFGARGWLVKGSIPGVLFPVEALVVGVSLDDVSQARNLMQQWRAGKVIKKVADLAKPLRGVVL